MKVVAAQAVVLDMQNRTERIVGAATVGADRSSLLRGGQLLAHAARI